MLKLLQGFYVKVIAAWLVHVTMVYIWEMHHISIILFSNKKFE